VYEWEKRFPLRGQGRTALRSETIRRRARARIQLDPSQ